MIVNSRQDGWEIIYQRAHANLAATILSAWQKKDRIPRWTELIIATAQHDDHEIFWSDTPHISDSGAPLNFTQCDLDTTRLQSEQIIRNAYRQNRWIALLISMHTSYLYESERGQNEKLDHFLDEQMQNQQQWRKSLGCSQQEADDAYAFLRWADRLSLILCRRQIPERQRELDIAPDKDGTMCRVMRRAEGSLKITPWVFEEDDVCVSIEVRYLDQLKFEDEAAFQDALDKAPVEIREWHLSG